MTARERRLVSDYEQVKKDFAGHKNIIVTPIGEEPPEQYHVTYFVNGIYLLPDGRIETLGRHEVDIQLHAEYPRYKPVCRISTPIWHPNFRDGQICIGDIWGAGESLSDIIINIGNMIQYQSWNSSSPLCADAARWAIENKHMFPVGNVSLYVADHADVPGNIGNGPVGTGMSAGRNFAPNGPEYRPQTNYAAAPPAAPYYPQAPMNGQQSMNDFEITAEELVGIQYVPSAQRMQTGVPTAAKGGRVNIKTIFVKGVLWAVIGAFLGFLVGEGAQALADNSRIASLLGHSYLSDYYEYSDKADKAFEIIYKEYKKYCRKNGIDPNDESAITTWYKSSSISSKAEDALDDYLDYDDRADEAFYDAYQYEFGSSENNLQKAAKRVSRLSTAVWASSIALFIGLFLGLGEGIFYGSKENALKYALIGAAVSIAMGFLSGDLAQLMYAAVIDDSSSLFVSSLVRGLGWSIMGLGTGAAVGLIKPDGKRILFCVLGGFAGAFAGGFLFNYVGKIIDADVASRGVAILIMGLLIGIGVGLLEQFAKTAWLKVIRGEFEGKEYLVFAGLTSIGNNGKNTIVLFKDKLVGPHHCDINLDGSKYVLTDCGTPMGTVVNGTRITRHVLKQGDSIAIGNSVLVFYTK